jgi:hypothetical protein
MVAGNLPRLKHSVPLLRQGCCRLWCMLLLQPCMHMPYMSPQQSQQQPQTSHTSPCWLSLEGDWMCDTWPAHKETTTLTQNAPACRPDKKPAKQRNKRTIQGSQPPAVFNRTVAAEGNQHLPVQCALVPPHPCTDPTTPATYNQHPTTSQDGCTTTTSKVSAPTATT